MSTKTRESAPPKTSPAPARKRGTRRGRGAKATSAKTKRRRTTTEQATLAAMANGKAKPAARISSANISRVQGKLGGAKPTAYLGISGAMLAKLASGAKTKADLKEPARVKLRDLGSALGSDTYYGRKLAGMLWAVEKGV